MKNKLFIHNLFFRLLAPPLAGTIIYIFILTIFGSLNQLIQNFFSQEVFFTVILTYTIFECMRFSIQLSEKRFASISLQRRAYYQVALNVGLAILLTVIMVSGYFIFLLGYSKFYRELIAFTSVFLIVALFYNLLYFSLLIYKKKNEEELANEEMVQTNIENEFCHFRQEINPDLFFSSLETLILLIIIDLNESEKYIQALSSVYRYILDIKDKEMVTLKQEIEHLNNIHYLLRTKYNNNIELNHKENEYSDNEQLIPLTLSSIYESIVNQSIISRLKPLIINLSKNDTGDYEFAYNNYLKFNLPDTNDFIDRFNMSYNFFSNKSIQTELREGQNIVRVPSIRFEKIEPLE